MDIARLAPARRNPPATDAAGSMAGHSATAEAGVDAVGNTYRTPAILAVLNGNTAAFGDLVCRYQDRLFHAVIGLVETNEDAADVVQDTFVRAFVALRSFKGNSELYTWLYRIALNLALGQRRKKRSVSRLDFASGSDPVDTSAGIRPGEAIERREAKAGLHGALARLSPGQRDVLVRKDLNGQRYEDIALVLAVPVGTVRSRLHRARKELRQLLGPDRN
jgi:RNA polymerase sigma-70 factor (ECF subfamily)